MVAGFIVGNSAYSMNFQQNFPINCFLYLVVAPVLNNQLLVENNKDYYLPNCRDSLGYTPMHYLTIREDATIEHVDALLKRGADPTIRTNIRMNIYGKWEFGDDPHKTAIKYNGRSPVETPITSFFEHQCYGNKEVANYIFCTILTLKLERAIPLEANKRAQQAEDRAAIRGFRENLEKQQKELEQQREMSKSVPMWCENTKELVVGAK